MARGAGSASFAAFLTNAEVFGVDGADFRAFNATRHQEHERIALVKSQGREQVLRLGPRAEHVHVFSTPLDALWDDATLAGAREVGRTGMGLPLRDIDVLIDDADHFRATQEGNFKQWFPRVADGTRAHALERGGCGRPFTISRGCECRVCT